MRNLILLLVLISGALAGYFVGDYRGKEARKALELAIETGKTLESERQATLTKLKTELDGINEKHQQELDTSRKEYATKEAEWQSIKSGLNGTISNLKEKRDKDMSELKHLLEQLDGATGPERAALEQKIAALRRELDGVKLKLDSNLCLDMPVPSKIIDLLNGTGKARGE